jgi:zinc protease
MALGVITGAEALSSACATDGGSALTHRAPGTHHRAPLARPFPRTTPRAPTALAEITFGPTLRARRHRLPNGLGVLTLVDRTAPVVSYQTWFKVGSRDEKPGKTGLAHLFEHLMFNETRSLAHGEFDRRIENAGGETNASTWVDWTHYHSEVPASELPVIVALEADRMANLVLRKPQLESEREVVQNERRFRVDDDVEGIASEALYATAYTRHPYRHPTIGWKRDIAAFTTEDCRHFYRTYYAPNNALVVVAGDFDEAHLLRLLRVHYGKLLAVRVPPPPRVREPPQRGERTRILRRPTPTEKVALGYHAPEFGHADYAALSVLNELLLGSRSSRLFRRLVEDQDLVADLHGHVAPFADPGLYEMWFSLREGQRAARALRVVDREVRRLREERVPDAELGRVKNRVELAFLMALETAGGKAEQAGFYEAVLGDAGLLFTRLEEFRHVRADDVRRVARTYLHERNRTRVTVLPKASA